MSDRLTERPPSVRWRESALRAQQEALPVGAAVVSCSAPLGTGGLGRHLQEIIDALERAGQPTTCICRSTRGAIAGAGRHTARHALGIPYLINVLPHLPLRVSPGVRTRALMVECDDFAASHLPAAEHLIAFNGQALTQFRAARAAGYRSLGLVSANSHFRQLIRRHEQALARYPIERSWTTHLLERNLAEYAAADRIYVASDYIRDSFLEQGFAEEAMVDFPLTPDPRYHPDGEGGQGETFNVVYVGSLHVHKGVPLLIDAFRRLAHADIRLVLVGGWGTRGMRRFVQAACTADSRISVRPGDPLPHLRSAGVCVHPAYEDGFAYAPAEALASGVPVIVSEDTGMKELIEPGRTGTVLETGDLDALTEALEGSYRRELLSGGRSRP